MLDDGTERPFSAESDDPDSELVWWCGDCDADGLPRLPYHEFKWEVVARFDREFHIARSEVRAWLLSKGVNPAIRARKPEPMGQDDRPGNHWHFECTGGTCEDTFQAFAKDIAHQMQKAGIDVTVATPE